MIRGFRIIYLLVFAFLWVRLLPTRGYDSCPRAGALLPASALFLADCLWWFPCRVLDGA